MAPATALPIASDFKEVSEYVDSLLNFATSNFYFQTLVGGVHIMDFFTHEPNLYKSVLPADWQTWLKEPESMELLNLLMRDDLETLSSRYGQSMPESLIEYVKDIRRLSLRRAFEPKPLKQKTLPRHIAVGMVPKKIHEVVNFANYVANVADELAASEEKPITHFVDFGAGQNYLGRAMASAPYNRHVIAVESKEININGAKDKDVLAGIAEREVVMRNKRLWRQKLEGMTPEEEMNAKQRRRAARTKVMADEDKADLRPVRELQTIYKPEEGKGHIHYVEQRLLDGDLAEVVEQIKQDDTSHQDPRLMAISIHSCGNLSHHGIRSLLLNDSVKAVAIVGCCYNLLTERLGPPTYKLPTMRPNLRPINGRVLRESMACDPHGFPLSNRVATHNGHGISLNITARMMACQAPQNWTQKESEGFFTRHFYRALLQKVFLDYGVVSISSESGDEQQKTTSTEPIIVGSLRKSCYNSFVEYVRGALSKLTATIGGSSEECDGECAEGAVKGKLAYQIHQKMGAITDAEIQAYEDGYRDRKKELSTMWSLMAFSAGVVESVIVTDRWLFLKEHPDVVKDAWVEPVFEYGLSPRNLVVVGIKR